MDGVRFNEEKTKLLEKILDKLLEVKEIMKGTQEHCARMQQSFVLLKQTLRDWPNEEEEENGPIAEDEIVQEEKKNAELQICFHDQAMEGEVLTAVEGEEIGTRLEETKARDPAFKLEISSCMNVWQHDRVEINTPSYTSLTRISTTTEQIFPVEGIPSEGPRLVWHPPWTWDVTHSPSNPKKFQTIAATQPIGVESLVALHQQTHREMMLLREKFLDSPFLAFNFRMGEKQRHFFKAGLEDLAVIAGGAGSILGISDSSHFTMLLTMTVDKLQNRTPRSSLEDHGLHRTLSSLCLLEVPELEHVLDCLEDLVAATSLASIWMSDCCEDRLMRRMMELQWREILRESIGHGVDASRNIQPPSQVDPNAYVVNSFTRRPHMQEPVGHCNPAWNYQGAYNLVDNISLQQGIEPRAVRRPLFFFAQQLGSWLVQVFLDLHLYAMFLFHLQAQIGNHLNRRDVQMAFHNYGEVEADMIVAALPMDERRITIFGLMKVDEAGRMFEFVDNFMGKIQLAPQLLGVFSLKIVFRPFDRGRPRAGMATDFHARGLAPDEAFEGCLRVVQTFPLAQFQIGLAKLALLSGHLSSSQVFGVIKQAMQHAPHLPESHYLHGLVCESRFDYQSAAAAYWLACCAISNVSTIFPNSHTRDISFNLARSLCRAGNAQDALQECENLKKEGMLDTEGLHIYDFSLWQLGKCDLALSVMRSLAVSISTMKQTSVAAPVGFICRMPYFMSGVDSIISNILKMPKELFLNSGISFIVSAINALDQIIGLESVVSSHRSVLRSHEEITGMLFFYIALGKLIRHVTEFCLGFWSGVAHLTLHKFPNSILLRNLLGYLLLSSTDWNDTHLATRCYSVDAQTLILTFQINV